MATYKEHVAADLDRWIAGGLVPEASRAPILASIPDQRRMDAAQTLAWIGGILAGIAVIAFVSANWDALPRLAQFAVTLGFFGGTAGGAAWCAASSRPHAANGLLTFAAIFFAAAIGLTGQIFDIPGDAKNLLYASGLVAAALALAGQASGPAIVMLVFFALADFEAPDMFGGVAQNWFYFPWLVVAAPAAAALAVRWRSSALAHCAAFGLLVAAGWLAVKLEANAWTLVAFAVVLTAAAAVARFLRERGRPGAGVLYGWLVWAAMGFYVASGIGDHGQPLNLAHRFAWLLLGGGLTTLGRMDRMGAVTAIGVFSLIGAVSMLMYDLGLGLLGASAMFLLAALIAGVIGLVLRGRGKPTAATP
jgi:uncharacterized membrane protein